MSGEIIVSTQSISDNDRFSNGLRMSGDALLIREGAPAERYSQGMPVDANGVLVVKNVTAGMSIGIPGQQGFGVGICPNLPDGYSMMSGTLDPASDNYGNYLYKDGSVMVWIPAYYYRVGHPDNPTYAAYGDNSIDIKPLSEFTGRDNAAQYKYALHRAFIDGGQIKPGFMYDKYRVSNNSGVASSIKNKPPLTFHATHNPVSDINGVSGVTYSQMFAVAKSRGQQFFPSSRFMRAALAMLSMAHGQASDSDTHCAWYDAGNANFPKGNNNNALGDTNDATVSYVSDGFQNCALTGSGTPFAKTTHNGQACGIADLNGNVYTVESGVTCIASSKSISGVTLANPVVVSCVGHGFETGDTAMISGVVGTIQLNDRLFKITVIDANSFSLDGTNGTAFTAYASGGTVTAGKFYVTKESARMADYTGGNTQATDHWGTLGVAATMEQIPDALNTEYPNNNIALRFGNAANQVISGETSGPEYMRAGLGFAKASGASSAGSALFGNDYHYQYVRNELALLSGMSWTSTANAGVWSFNSCSSRASSNINVSLSAASYPL